MIEGERGSDTREIDILFELKVFKVKVIVNLRRSWSCLKAFSSPVLGLLTESGAGLS